jgi:hypothetical protein
MTTKAAFAPEEWTVVLEGPPTAGMIVITAAPDLRHGLCAWS